MTPYQILVIDDDIAHAETMGEILERTGHHVTVKTTGNDGLQHIRQGNVDIILTDLIMNDVDGFAILKEARNAIEDVQVIMVTGHGSVETAVKAMQEGALTYLNKPVNIDEVRAVVQRACERVSMARENRSMHLQLDEKFGFQGLIGNAPKMTKIYNMLQQVSPTDATVLITGESGTGKELIAKCLHNNSPRKQKNFVPLNCAALSGGILESELFGHVKGAFTGAVSNRQGKFEFADGGTLFLDEVGDIPPSVQVKLLRTVESGEITPVGSNITKHVNVRIVAATNRNMEEAVAAGDFREDLYFRLKVIHIHMPPLRERKQDIPLLLDSFIKELSTKYDKSITGISQPARQRVYQYDWPGNIRELRNAVESMVVVCPGSTIGLDDLPEPFDALKESEGGVAITAGMAIADMERQLIQETLKLVNGNRAEAARMLGIGERTLYRKITEYDLRQTGRR